MTIYVVAVVAAIGVLAIFYGIAQTRTASADLQARLAEYGVVDPSAAGAAAAEAPPANFRERMARIFQPAADQLGDTLLLLSNALKAGYSFAQAIDTVSKNATPPIAEEFARCVREMNLGGTVEESLGHMVKRIESDDLDLMVTAVAIHRTVGGNLAEILDNIAFTIRERVRIKGQIATLTASARSSGQLITSLPVVLAVFMYFATPTYFKPMTESPVGWIIMAIALVMIALGNVVMSRVTAIEV